MNFRLRQLAQVALTMVVGLALLVQGQATAATIPPDNSAADQYTEGYPGWTGTEQVDPNSDPTKNTLVPKKTSRKFGKEGQVGEAALALAISTAPNRKAGLGEGGSAGSSPSSSRSGASDPGLEVAVQAFGVSGYGGMGYGLPIILLATTVLAIGYWMGRKRASR